MTHPHKDLIIQLLNDPTLEVEVVDLGKWVGLEVCGVAQMAAVLTAPHRQFRLHEKPKPDVVRYGRARIEWLDMNQDADNNVKFTFTADGVLKSAEVLQ